jgi:hypothetical protein
MKYLRGSVATYRAEDGTPTTDCVKVLATYSKWGETPKTWGDLRAMELGVVCSWALRKIEAAEATRTILEELHDFLSCFPEPEAGGDPTAHELYNRLTRMLGK